MKNEFREMVKNFDGDKACSNIAGSVCEHYAIEFAKTVLSKKNTTKDVKLWEKLKKELALLDDNNYTARKLFDYIKNNYGRMPIKKIR